jgi:hypothetical protein
MPATNVSLSPNASLNSNPRTLVQSASPIPCPAILTYSARTDSMEDLESRSMMALMSTRSVEVVMREMEGSGTMASS